MEFIEERYCEICDKFVGVMSQKAWEAMDYLCEDCIEKEDLENIQCVTD